MSALHAADLPLIQLWEGCDGPADAGTSVLLLRGWQYLMLANLHCLMLANLKGLVTSVHHCPQLREVKAMCTISHQKYSM
jgi:hypothetical protein